MDRVIIEKNGEEMEVDTKRVENSEELKPLLNRDCMQILASLQEKPSYPALLAKELSMNEQNAYYCIKKLKNAGLIEIEKTEERNGATAKYYTASYNSFTIIPNEEALKTKTKIMKTNNSSNKAATEFLKEFTKKGIFAGKIVVGSPDAHGTYKARARDGHLAAELSAFIGANCKGVETPIIFLDTMVKDLKNENTNLIIIGGPLTNKLAEQMNEYLPIKFVPSGGNWMIKSEKSGKEYADDTIGVIEKIPHPHFKGKWILLLAGKRNSGTISAIITITKNTQKLIKNSEKEITKIVEGLDRNGDGLIDEVEFKE